MPKLVVIDREGNSHEHQADDGETLWNACLNAGVELTHSCGFGCQCSTCCVQVVEGHQNLSHLDEEEVHRCKIEGITIADPDDPESGSNPAAGRVACRLSCACQIFGDVVVKQPE